MLRMNEYDTCPICLSSNITFTLEFDNGEAVYKCENCKVLLKNNLDMWMTVRRHMDL